MQESLQLEQKWKQYLRAIQNQKNLFYIDAFQLSEKLKREVDSSKLIIQKGFLNNKKNEEKYDQKIETKQVEKNSPSEETQHQLESIMDKDFRTEVRKVLQDSLLYVERGHQYVQKNKHEEAIVQYKIAYELNPTDFEILLSMGLSYRRLGHVDKAIECYQEVIKYDQKCDTAYFNIGIAYKLKSKFGKTLAAYNKAIEINPKSWKYYYNKGKILNEMKQYDQSIASFDQAIRCDPIHPKIYNSKGIAHYKLDQFLQAIECYDKAIELDPQYDIAYHNKAKAYNDIKRYNEANEAFNTYKNLTQMKTM